MSLSGQQPGDAACEDGPGRDGDQGLDRAEAEAQLALVPRRLARWEEQDGRVVVHRPRPRTRGLAGLRDRLQYLMAPGRIRLDEVGSTIWLAMDGSATIADLAALVPPEPEGAQGEPDHATDHATDPATDQLEPSDDRSELAARRVGLFLRVLLNHGLATLDEPGEDAPVD